MNLRALISVYVLAVVALLSNGSLALADNKDCPFIGRIPNYSPANDNAGNVAIWHSFDSFDYHVANGASSKVVTQSGKHCKQQYWPAPGSQRMSDLEIMENFKEQLPQEGATIVYSDDGEIDATVSKDGSQYWIKIAGGSQSITANVMQLQPFKTTIGVPSASGFTQDCPFIGRIPNYNPANDNSGNKSEWRNYSSYNFLIADGASSKPVTQLGKTCKQQYWPVNGAQRMSDLEVMANFKAQLSQEGAKTVYSDTGKITATLTKDGADYWIEVNGGEQSITAHVVQLQAFKRTLLPPSGNDYRLLGHMPNYVAAPPQKMNYDQMNFNAGPGQVVNVRGAKYVVTYNLPNSMNPVSVLEVQQNYRAALKDLNADILTKDDVDNERTVARLDDHGTTVWLEIYTGFRNYRISVIEEKPFVASIKPPQADEMKSALEKLGHIALYINFDFNKATLKPDATPIIAQVVTLLKNNPTLNVAVQGNTDSIGGHDYNVKLSQDRAAAVVAAIVKAGIAASRLKSAGFGPDKPIADNATDEGRAKNRRVELVKD